jgi:type IV secretory pathway TraG/TraD family ATPase VirD4
MQELLLELIIWAFGTPTGLATLVLLTIVSFGFQFLRSSSTILPLIFGGAFGLASMAAFTKGQKIAASVKEKLGVLQGVTPQAPSEASTSGVPVFEFIFKLFLGAPDERSYLGEVLLVAFVTYLVFVILDVAKKHNFDFSTLQALFQRGNPRPNRSKSNELGSGDLAHGDQILRWTKPSGRPGDTSLAVTGLRGAHGVALRIGKLVIPKEERNRHVLIVAKTGSGKTTRMILPILYSDCMCQERSTIVIDSKPEMWQILLFNPLDRARSLSWNILSKIEDDTDAKLIANTIVMATDNPSAKADSPFFRNNALSILNSIMVGLLHDKSDVLSMPRIHELVQSGMKPLCNWLEQHPHAYRTSRTFVELARSGSQNADTIMSELSMRLAAWDLLAIRATTSKSELDLETLIEKPTLFIVELRESELEMLRPMANVIVVEILRFLTKRAEACPGVTLPRPVGLVIDEFASALGRLPDIHVKLNTLRSRNVSICAAIQSTAQVKANYADDADSVLAGFSTKIFMPALDLVDSEWASKESGQMTIRFRTASAGTNKKVIEFFASRNDSTQEQVQQRAVLTPDEIGRPVDNIATFFMPNTPVFQGFLVPYYKDGLVAQRIKEFDAPDRELKLREEPIPYEETLPEAPAPGDAAQNAPTPGITNVKGWTDQQIQDKLTEVKKKLEWESTTGSARKWWEAFENENKHRLALVLRLAEELQNRKATITEFFLAYVYSNTDNIQANLSYLDYTRLKKEEERRKKEAAAKAQPAAAAAA